MRISPAIACVAVLVGAIALPARATHEPVQTLPVDGQASEVYVGLGDDGTATAAWDDDGAVKVATRPADGFFGVPQTIETGSAGDVAFDASPNGNAVVAWSGGMSEGTLLAATRVAGGAFGPPQVLVGPGGSAPLSLDVAISDAGSAVAVWEERPAGADSMVRATLSDSSGVFGTAVTVHQAPNLQGPKVDMDDLGNALAVWDALSSEVVQGSAAPAGGAFGPVKSIKTLEQGAGAPDVAVNSTGVATVVWKNFAAPDSQCDTVAQCAPVAVLEAAYGDVDGSLGVPQAITDLSQSTTLGEHEPVVDDSGRAAILFTATLGNTPGVYAALSDAAGTFSSGAVRITHVAAAGAASFEIAAGDGEFTAFWANDHDQDGVGEAWQATSAGGSFGAPHQISPEDDSSASMVHGDRNDNGQTIGAWVIDLGSGNVPQVAPVATGSPPEFGSETDDELTGTEGDDVVHLLGGNDTYSGGAGNDSIYGGDGDDVLRGDEGSDLVDGGPGSDTTIGGSGDDQLLGRGGNDKLKGGLGDDELRGGGGNDVLDGGGASSLRASGAATNHKGEIIFGGPGKDTCFKYSRQDVLKSCEVIKRKRAH